MRKNLLFSLFLLLVSATTLPAQACDFDQLMREGRAFLDKKKPEYRRALSKFNASRTCDPSKSAEVDKEVGRLFSMIEAERDKAVRLEKEARAAQAATKIALDSARVAQARAEEAERKATAVLDKIYFYDGRFGLAYDKSKRLYGFIDKNLNTKIEFKYDEAQPFDETGLAKVKRFDGGNLSDFFIDTLGNEYPLATELSQLSPQITALDLRQKELTEIPNSVLKSTQLKILLLSDNHLDYLPSQISKLKNLQVLDLYYNQLDSIPIQIGELKNLQLLNLSYNQLDSIPIQIGELKNLQLLDLSYNQLKNLPTQIGELKNLQLLYLYGNQLQNLPAQIGELKNLQSLYLFDNQLQSLPTQIGELENLQLLNLSYNQLQRFPAQIVELKKLQFFDIGGNQLQSLPAQIGELQNLQSLNLTNNQLQTLPVQIGELKKLKTIYLYGNKLKTLGCISNCRLCSLFSRVLNQVDDLLPLVTHKCGSQV